MTTHSTCALQDDDYETGMALEGEGNIDSDIERESRADYDRRDDCAKEASFELKKVQREAMRKVGRPTHYVTFLLVVNGCRSQVKRAPPPERSLRMKHVHGYRELRE